MPERPKEFPLWAMIDKRNEITGQNNALPPPEEKQLLGFHFKEQPARNWLNWLFRNICQWLQYFDGRITDIEVSTGAGSSQLNTRLDTTERILANQIERVDNANNAIGTLQNQMNTFASGGATNTVITREVGTGFASITEVNCTFTIQVYTNCSQNFYLCAYGYRRGNRIQAFVLNHQTLTLGAPNENFQFPIEGHAMTHLEAHITMIKGA